MSTPRSLHIIADSGVPRNSTDYTTAVLFHGYAWTSEAFRKMIPFAKAHNARLVLVNRRDYAWSTPYTVEERAEVYTAVVESKTDAEAARNRLLAFMRERAREVYDLLVHIVAEHKIPLAHAEANTGGIVVGGWSFGTTLMTALLANMASFPVGDVDLRKYLRRVVFLDPPDLALGFAPFPVEQTTETPVARHADTVRDLSIFYSAYFKHGDVDKPETYEGRTPLAHPRPTWDTFTPEEVDAIFEPVPGDTRGGSDFILMSAGMSIGTFATLREEAIRLAGGADAKPAAGSWDAVEARHLWCDYSVAPMIFAALEMKAELERQTKAGTRLRKVTFARVEGANHIMVWDFPERTLEAILRA